MKYRLTEQNEIVHEPDLLRWAFWFETASLVVEQTHVGPCLISTIFTGVDYNCFNGGKPLLFETMVFRGPMDRYQERWTSWVQAQAGHDRVAAAMREEYPIWRRWWDRARILWWRLQCAEWHWADRAWENYSTTISMGEGKVMVMPLRMDDLWDAPFDEEDE